MENIQVTKVVEGKKLTPAFELVGKTFSLYFEGKNIKYILKVIGTQFLIGFALFIPLFLIFGVAGVAATLTGSNGSESMGLGAGILSIIGLLVFAVIIYWFGAADIIMVGNIVEGKVAGVKETLKAGWKMASRYFVVSFVVGLVMLLGYVLLVIPGIIFSVWYSLANIIAVLENKDMGNSMSRSKSLVQNYFWPVLGRFMLIGVIAIVINLVLQFIPIAGTVLIAFISPLFILYLVLLYKDLLRVKGV